MPPVNIIIHCSLMHSSYLSIIWSFWPISSSLALKYEFHLSLSSLEGLIDLEAWPDEFEYASPEMISGLLRRTLVPSLTCPGGAGYPIEVVAIVEEVEIPETLLYTRNRMFQYWIQNLAEQTYRKIPKISPSMYKPLQINIGPLKS